VIKKDTSRPREKMVFQKEREGPAESPVNGKEGEQGRTFSYLQRNTGGVHRKMKKKRLPERRGPLRERRRTLKKKGITDRGRGRGVQSAQAEEVYARELQRVTKGKKRYQEGRFGKVAQEKGASPWEKRERPTLITA